MSKMRRCAKCGLGLTRRSDVAYVSTAGPICEWCKDKMNKESKLKKEECGEVKRNQ